MLKLPVERHLWDGEDVFAGGSEAAGGAASCPGLAWNGASLWRGHAESWLSGYYAALEAKGSEHLPVFLGAASLPWCSLISLDPARGWFCLGCMFGGGE